MAKQGMKRPDRTHVKPKNDVSPVPEINGKAKHGHLAANPLTRRANREAFHTVADTSVFGPIVTDLGLDNQTNDLTAADLQDL